MTAPRRPARAASLLRLALGLALFAGLVWYLAPSWEELTASVQIALPALALGLVGAAAAHVAVAARWKLLSEATGGNRLSLWAYFHSLVLTRLLGQFVPSLAMDLVGRGVALRSVGSQRGVGHAMTLVVLERIFDLLIPAALVGWALLARQPGLEERAGTLLGLATVLFVVVATPALRPLAALALAAYRRLRHVDAASVPVGITTVIAFQVACLGVARFACVLLQFAGIGAGVGVLLSWVDWTASTPVAQLTALVGITPGGLGVVEVGWWAGLAWVGVERGSIALFVLAQRIALIAFLGLLTLLSWPLARRLDLRVAGSR